jgi:hypothetical protein
MAGVLGQSAVGGKIEEEKRLMLWSIVGGPLQIRTKQAP